MEPVTSQPEIDENGVVSGILEPRHLKPLRGMPFFASITTDTFITNAVDVEPVRKNRIPQLAHGLESVVKR